MFSVFVSGYRRRRREREAMRTLGVDPCAWTQPDAGAPGVPMNELTPRMRRAVDALPQGFRQVLLLVDVGEHSYRDVADLRLSRLNEPLREDPRLEPLLARYGCPR